MLDKFVSLEKVVFKVIKTLTFSQAMNRRTYFFDLMRIKRLSELCIELKQNYNPTRPTAYDDRVVFTQLDMDLTSLQSQVKFWKMDQQLYIFVDSNKKKGDREKNAEVAEAKSSKEPVVEASDAKASVSEELVFEEPVEDLSAPIPDKQVLIPPTISTIEIT